MNPAPPTMKNRPILIFFSEPQRLCVIFFFLLKAAPVRKRLSPTPAPKPAVRKENSVHAGDELIIVDSLPTVDLKTLRISPGHALIEKRIPEHTACPLSQFRRNPPAS